MLYGALSRAEREELYAVFRRVGEGLNVKELPADYERWRADRRSHMERDLAHGRHTALLYESYRRHLGEWRYRLLLQVQALLVPERVRRLPAAAPPARRLLGGGGRVRVAPGAGPAPAAATPPAAAALLGRGRGA